MPSSPLRLAALYASLLLVASTTIGPFLWLLMTALKAPGEDIFSFPPSLFPAQPTLHNFAQVWKVVPFATYLLNSVLVAVLAVVFNLLLASLAAYPLARMRFRGQGAVFLMVLSTMMIPFPAIMIPLFVTCMGLHRQLQHLLSAWLHMPALAASPHLSYTWLVLPTCVSAFGIFMMRQAFLAIPRELEESVLIDGGSHWTIWRHVMIPLSRPALAALAIFTFVGSWGDFLWPLLVLNREETYTLPLGVAKLAGTFSSDWRLVAAGSVLAIVPILVFFFTLQRHFIGGATAGAVKG